MDINTTGSQSSDMAKGSSSAQRAKEKPEIAKESDKILRAREKLETQTAIESGLITSDSKATARKKNLDWLNRHQGERINLKTERQISPFDENRHPAIVQDKFVKQTMKQIYEQSTIISTPLKGRVKAARSAPAA